MNIGVCCCVVSALVHTGTSVLLQKIIMAATAVFVAGVVFRIVRQKQIMLIP